MNSTNPYKPKRFWEIMTSYYENFRNAKIEIENYLLGEEYNRDLLERISGNDNRGTRLGNILEAFFQVHIKTSPPNNCCKEAMVSTKKLIDLMN